MFSLFEFLCIFKCSFTKFLGHLWYMLPWCHWTLMWKIYLFAINVWVILFNMRTVLFPVIWINRVYIKFKITLRIIISILLIWFGSISWLALTLWIIFPKFKFTIFLLIYWFILDVLFTVTDTLWALFILILIPILAFVVKFLLLDHLH